MAADDLKTWMVADRNGEFKVFAKLEWEELGGGGWTIVAEHLTEEEATKEMIRRAPPGKRAP